jgi:hypothetical protein
MAATAIVGTGLVDKLLFQGISAGVHLKPTRYVTLYTTLGASEKTGDSRSSLNQMYGATWSEIAHSGIRADFHYSKFDSNFAKGNYQVLSLSRRLTNLMFWNVRLGKQDMLSRLTTNYNSIFVADSLDINIGRHSYLQSGYTYVNGATLNYRQWYLSWGYRFDKGKATPSMFRPCYPAVDGRPGMPSPGTNLFEQKEWTGGVLLASKLKENNHVEIYCRIRGGHRCCFPRGLLLRAPGLFRPARGHSGRVT